MLMDIRDSLIEIKNNTESVQAAPSGKQGTPRYCKNAAQNTMKTMKPARTVVIQE